jgi:hypothetical protein
LLPCRQRLSLISAWPSEAREASGRDSSATLTRAASSSPRRCRSGRPDARRR